MACGTSRWIARSSLINGSRLVEGLEAAVGSSLSYRCRMCVRTVFTDT